MKIIGLLICMNLFSNIILAQDSLQRNFQTKRIRDSLIINEKFPALRIGIGLQKSFYTEIGLSYNKIYGSEYGSFGSYEIYTSVLYIPKIFSQPTIYGAKLGAVVGSFGGIEGIEITYLTDNSIQDVMITPKIGVGLFTYLELMYGYSFSTNHRPFNTIGRHQFSLVSNLPVLKFFKKTKKVGYK